MAGEPGRSPRITLIDAEDDLRLEAFELDDLQAAYARSMSPAGSVSSTGREKLPYGGKEPFVMALTNLVNQKAGLAWTSFSHTGVPVPVSASGVDAASFNGFYDNTGLHDRIVAAMGLDAPKAGGLAANRGGGAQGRP
jgi:alkaline phosphatase